MTAQIVAASTTTGGLAVAATPFQSPPGEESQ